MWWVQVKIKQMELTHQERLKCLEHGMPLPDAELAWVATVRERGQQLTAIMIVGTIFLTGAPVAGTAIMLSLGRELPTVGLLLLLAVVWCAPAFVLLCLARHTMAALAHLKRAMSNTAPPGYNVPATNGLKLMAQDDNARNATSEAIKTSWFGRPVAAEDDKQESPAAERTAASDSYLDDRP